MKMASLSKISPKVWAPVAAQIIAFLVNLIASGEFNRTELAQLVGLALTAVVGYLASPGDVAVNADNINADPAFAAERKAR
jgi:hypothetical protein